MEFFFSFIKVKNPNSAEGESCNLPTLDTRLRCLEIYKPFVTPSALEKEKVNT